MDPWLDSQKLVEVGDEQRVFYCVAHRLDNISQIAAEGGGRSGIDGHVPDRQSSFWIVPDSVVQLAPCRSATTRYIAKIIAAGELIVIDVVMSPTAMPSNSASMSASEVTLTPHL